MTQDNAMPTKCVFDTSDPFQAELRRGLQGLSDIDLSLLETEMLRFVSDGIRSRAVSLFLQLSGDEDVGAAAA
jgi:hypothetical protein